MFPSLFLYPVDQRIRNIFLVSFLVSSGFYTVLFTMSSSIDFLRQEIEDLKKLGESWNMEKYQIEKAIIKAIEDKNGNVPAQVEQDFNKHFENNRHGCCKTFLLVVCSLTVGILFTLAVGGYVYTNYSPFEIYVNHVVSELQYPVLRRWRMLLLPLHRYYDLEYLALGECLINNPWYLPEEADCSACEDAVDVPRLENVSNFSNLYAGWGDPIIVTDVSPYAARNYTMEDFMKYYKAHRQQFDDGLCEVSSLDGSVITVGDYYKLLEKLGPASPNIRWKICYGEGLRVVRKFFPKPYFVSTEGALEKFLMIISSNEEILPMPTGHYGNAWFAQVTGASEIQLRPTTDCNTTCSNLNVTLNKGEVMYVNQELWDADIVGNPSDEPAISFLSTFA